MLVPVPSNPVNLALITVSVLAALLPWLLEERDSGGSASYSGSGSTWATSASRVIWSPCAGRKDVPYVLEFLRDFQATTLSILTDWEQSLATHMRTRGKIADVHVIAPRAVAFPLLPESLILDAREWFCQL